MSGRSACLDALHAFAVRAFADWRGLPSACLVDDAFQVFIPQDEWIGTGKLGRNALAANYRFCHLPSYPAPIRVWFVGTEVRLIEAEGPLEGLPFAKVRGQLGEPDARLDCWYGFAAVRKGEWFYGARGIALDSDSGGGAKSTGCMSSPRRLCRTTYRT